MMNYLMASGKVWLPLFFLGYAHILHADSDPLDGKTLGGRNLVMGQVISVNTTTELPWVAQVQVTRVFGRPMSKVKVGTLFTMHTGPGEYPPDGNDYSYVVPQLKIGEIGIWGMSENVDHSGFRGESKRGLYGRWWPIIQGRDPGYEKIKAWAEELDKRPEVQADIDGRQWPAPKKRKPPLQPTLSPESNSQVAPIPNTEQLPTTSDVQTSQRGEETHPPKNTPVQRNIENVPEQPLKTKSFLLWAGVAVIGAAACIWFLVQRPSKRM